MWLNRSKQLIWARHICDALVMMVVYPKSSTEIQYFQIREVILLQLKYFDKIYRSL